MKINSSLANRLRLSALLAATSIALTTENALAQTNATDGTPAIIAVSEALPYDSSSIFNWNLNANSTTQNITTPIYDQVTGNDGKRLTAGGVFNVILGAPAALSNPFWNTSQSWIVFSGFNSGTSHNGSTFSSITEPTGLSTVRPGASFAVTAVTSGGVTLNYTAAAFVPEPTSALAGLLLTAGLLRRKRR